MENKIYFKGELKSSKDSDEGVFEGYASTFGNTDSTGDIIEFGAFADSLVKREPKVLWQHQMDKPIGKVLEAREDAKGLWVKVKLSLKTTLGKDAYEYLKDGVIDTMSIGFMIKESEWEGRTRIIKEVDLLEFSLVTIPANDKAKVTGVKSMPNNERDFEKFLRENGYDRTAAKAITSHGIKGYQKVLRDAGIKDSPDEDLRDANESEKLLKDISQAIKGVIECQMNKKNL